MTEIEKIEKRRAYQREYYKNYRKGKKALEYAVTFDNMFMLTPTAISYNSPYFNLLNYDSADLLVYGPLEENKRIDNFKWWLSGKCFDVISERNDFQLLLID